MKVLKKIFALLIAAAFTVFAAIQAVYWLNLDNKFMYLISVVLKKHYDNSVHDRKF